MKRPIARSCMVVVLDNTHAQFIAICSSSTLAEALCLSSPFSSRSREKRRVSEKCMPLLLGQLQLSTNSDNLSADRYKNDTMDESIAFLHGLYQSMLVELAKVAVTHDVHVLDLAFRYLERLKQIWEHD